MKNRSSLLAMLMVGGALMCASSSPARADETSDWNEWNALQTRLSEQKADVPTQVAQLKAYAGAPGRMVLLSAVATAKLCETLRAAGQGEAALSACDEGLTKWGQDPQDWLDKLKELLQKGLTLLEALKILKGLKL